MKIIQKEEAKEIGQKWYFTNIPCKNGHIDKRYTNTGICYACKRKLNQNCNSKNKESLKRRSKKSYIKNREKRLENSKSWAIKNREKSNQIKKNYKIRNRQKYLENARKYSKNQRKDPYKRMSKNLSKAIWECLKENNVKKENSWVNLVSFSIKELINHLQSKFDKNMSWENYGSYWHIDHIKPLSKFNLKEEFHLAWNLNNLQPLEAKENCRKNNKYIENGN